MKSFLRTAGSIYFAIGGLLVRALRRLAIMIGVIVGIAVAAGGGGHLIGVYVPKPWTILMLPYGILVVYLGVRALVWAADR